MIPSNAASISSRYNSIAVYSPISVFVALKNLKEKTSRSLLFLWGISLFLSIVLGLASIKYNWSGIPINLAGVTTHITIYPPLVISTLWTLWIGFWWGFIPAYVATFSLALYSAMPVSWSLLFAFADPLGLVILVLAYRTVPISIDLRSLISIIF